MNITSKVLQSKVMRAVEAARTSWVAHLDRGEKKTEKERMEVDHMSCDTA